MGVVKSVKDFLTEHGFRVMIFGISAAAAGVLLYALLRTPRYAGTVYPLFAVGLAVFGFAVYFVGRVSVAMQRSKLKRSLRSSIYERREEEEDDEDEFTVGGPAVSETPLSGRDGKDGQ